MLKLLLIIVIIIINNGIYGWPVLTNRTKCFFVLLLITVFGWKFVTTDGSMSMLH